MSIDVSSIYAGRPAGMQQEEWRARVDLAALYRLVALEGWDDLIFTHISLRVPEKENHYLINPFGMTFGAITASSLVKVDETGQPVDDTTALVSPAGFVIHGAIHAARPDAQCIIHLHTIDGAAVSACAEGLLPLTQHAMIIGSELAYHEYEGVVLDLEESASLIRDLGSKYLMLLRNHGTLAIAPNCGGAWLLIYYLERACSMQIKAKAATDRLLLPSDDIVGKVREQSTSWFDGTAGAFAWPAMLKKLEQSDASFRT